MFTWRVAIQSVLVVSLVPVTLTWAFSAHSSGNGLIQTVLTVVASLGLFVAFLTSRTFRLSVERILGRTRIEAARVGVSIGSLSLEFESPARSVHPASSGRSSGGQSSTGPDRISRLWRGAVLEEALNLGRFRFDATDVHGTDGEKPWQPSRLSCLIAGVHKDDIAALLAARNLREAKLGTSQAAPSTPDDVISTFA
jgi:hypothetical protein